MTVTGGKHEKEYLPKSSELVKASMAWRSCLPKCACQSDANGCILYGHAKYQRWSRGPKARGQGQGHKKKKSEAKDSLSEDRHSRGQRQECSRPRTKDTNASVLQKKVFKIFFQVISTKNGLEKIFSHPSTKFKHSENSTVLEPRTGQFSRT